MFYSVPTNHNCLCVYSESVPRSRATVTNMYNLMHMWHHVTNHLIVSNDKDFNSENRIKLRVRDIYESHQLAISQQRYPASYQDPIQV
jgi:hypothetical protein